MPPKLQLLAVVAFAVAMLFLENQIQKLEESRAKLGEAAERCARAGLAGGLPQGGLGESRELGPRHVELPPPGREAGLPGCTREVAGQRAAPSALLGERGPKSAWSWCSWRTRTHLFQIVLESPMCAAMGTGI